MMNQTNLINQQEKTIIQKEGLSHHSSLKIENLIITMAVQMRTNSLNSSREVLIKPINRGPLVQK